MNTYLYFYSAFCGPCKALASKTTNLSIHYRNRFLKLDIDYAQELGNRLGVKTFPTIITVHHDRVIEHIGPGGVVKKLTEIEKELNGH